MRTPLQIERELTEEERELLRAMATAVSAAERNRLGQFATPPALARTLLQIAAEYVPAHAPIRFLDPAVGTGGFFSALLDIFGSSRLERAVGFEIDAGLADGAARLWRSAGLEVRHQDFTRAVPPASEGDLFNLIVCNPPYVRHHHIDVDTKHFLRRSVARRCRIAVHGLAGLYCYFMLLADAWMARNATGVWLVPAEFLDVNYGAALRDYLTRQVTLSLVHRFDPEVTQFSDALVSSAIVVIQKNFPSPASVTRFSYGNSVFGAPGEIIRQDELQHCRRWGRHFRREALPEPKHERSCESLTIGDLFDIRRGIATGANHFFILQEEKAAALHLPEQFLIPILPSPRYVNDDAIPADDRGWPTGLPRLALLSCDLGATEIEQRFPALHRYLDSGLTAGLASRYLLRSRHPWYRQERRLPAPILCTYMARRDRDGRAFRFLRNTQLP